MSAAEFIAFTNGLDRCWMTGDFPALHESLARDVVFIAPGGSPRSEGLEPAIESYRQFMSQVQLRSFHASDPVVTVRGDAAVVAYRWQMAGAAAGREYEETGRDILVPARREEAWRVVWRTQIPNPAKST